MQTLETTTNEKALKLIQTGASATVQRKRNPIGYSEDFLEIDPFDLIEMIGEPETEDLYDSYCAFCWNVKLHIDEYDNYMREAVLENLQAEEMEIPKEAKLFINHAFESLMAVNV